MTVLGAGLQLLPVATVQSVRAVGLAKLLWWLLCGAVALFVIGVARVDTALAAVGATAIGVALLGHAGLLAANLFAARRYRAMIGYAWGGLAALLALIASGPALALQMRLGWFADPGGVALAHLIAACYGFLGLLAVGYSYLLVSMFMVTRAPSERAQHAVLGTASVAIAGCAFAALLGDTRRSLAGFALLGLAAALAYAVQMLRMAAKRRSRDAPWSLALMRIAWIALPTSVALGVAIAAARAGGAPEAAASIGDALALRLASGVAAAAFVVLVVLGWLLSFMLAMALRIVPFLASVHAKLRHGRLPLVSAMTPAAPARLVAIGHALAVAVLLAGVLWRSEPLVALSGAIGAAGSLAFLVFLGGVLRRAGAPGAGMRGGRVARKTDAKDGRETQA